MNLQGLSDAVTANGYTFSNLITDPQNPIVQALNATYRQVLGLQRWPFLEKQDTSISTTIGVNAYALSSIADLRQIDAVRIEIPATTQYFEIENKEPQDFRDLEHTDRDPSLPQFWTRYANQIKLWPYPDAVYLVRVDYIYDPPDLALGADIPVLPTKYHDILVWGAIKKLAFRERDWLGRNFAEGEFNAMLKQMQEEYLLMQRQTSSHVKRSGSWDTTVMWPNIRGTW